MHAVKDDKAYLVYITVANREMALSLARFLVRERLAAGVNVIGGVWSVYHWQGAVCEKDECLLLAQVSGMALSVCMQAVREQHDYEVPCIVALPITDGHGPFLHWIAENSFPLGCMGTPAEEHFKT